jgi:hypothetical protein
MDNEAEAKMDAVNNAVQGLATLLDQQGAMCTSWVLVSEWIDSEGNFWFSTHTEPDLAIWRRNGMLQHAIDTGTMQHYIDQGVSNDEGDNY